LRPPSHRRRTRSDAARCGKSGQWSEKNKLSIKDGLTITLSSLAFLVSVGSFYFSTVRQSDDLRVIITNVPGVSVVSNDRLSVGRGTIVFINSGNRTAAVVRIAASILQPIDVAYAPTKGECGEEGGPGQHTLNYDQEPFSIKGPDIVTKNLAFAKDIKDIVESENATAELQADGSLSIPVTPENKRRGQYEARVCVLFRIATPRASEAVRTASVFLYDVKLVKEDNEWRAELKLADDFWKSVTLLRHQGNIFTDY
jgi:hypothetical protein